MIIKKVRGSLAMPSCVICRSTAKSYENKEDHITLHHFPKRMPHVLVEWKKFAQIPEHEPTDSKRLCSRHFKKEDIIYLPLRTILKHPAIPCFYPPKSCPSSLHQALITSENGGDDDSLELVEVVPDIITECCKVKQEDMSSHLVLEDVRKELCRLCGQKASMLIPLFEAPYPDTTQVMSLSSKIEMYLPFKVKMDDPLPSHICSNCNDILNHWHELYVTCVAADAVLWKTFGRESEKSSENHLDCGITSVQEVQQDVFSISPEIEAQSQQEPLMPLMLDETKKKPDMLCEECRKKKTSAIPPEDDLFIKEFDKNYANFHSISYKCYYCYELFKSPPDRKNHIAMCGQLSTICELCGHKVSCRKDLRRHKYQKHTKKIIRQRYLCEKCEKCFKTAAGLSYHTKLSHEQDHSPKYHCELCCTAFVSEHHFHIHQKKHAKGKIKSVFPIEAIVQDDISQNSGNSALYQCPVCQEIFIDSLSLVVHLTTKKKVKCSVCQKILSCEKRFLLHECGQWTCQYCLITFDKRIKWIVHERLHTGEKPIKCRTCDVTFRTWQARRRHEAHHNPKFQCSYCGKSFRNKYVFRDHVLCHEGKIFLCQICEKKFSGRRNLCKHINIFHKNITVSK